MISAHDHSVQLNDIEAALRPIYAAYCGNCTNTEDSDMTEREFAKHLYGLGWRCDSDGELYCPKCAKTNITH